MVQYNKEKKETCKNEIHDKRAIFMVMDASGSLELINGPMFSGKTSEILRRLLIDEAIGFSVVYINHSLDTRGSGPFSTHNSLYNKDLSHRNITFLSSLQLSDLTEKLRDFDTIGIDEAQFFQDLVKTVPGWVESLNKKVIVAGLTGDFQRRKFGQLLDLEPLADSFTRLASYCLPCAKRKIKKEAFFTHRTTENKTQVSVGGLELYIPVCRRCYKALNE